MPTRAKTKRVTPARQMVNDRPLNEVPELDEDDETVTYTTAEEWPDGDGGQDLTLPSGAKVRVATPAIFWAGLTGRIPANLRAIGKKHIADKKDWSPEENEQALNWLLCESFVSPKVSLSAKPGYLPLSKLSDADKQAVAATLRLQTYSAAMK